MPVQRIQLRRGTAAEWVDANPVLADGEPGVERDTGKQKVGDGVTAWASLPYTAEKGDPGLTGPPNTDASLLSTGTVPEGRLPTRLTPGELSATYAPASLGTSKLDKTEAASTYRAKADAALNILDYGISRGTTATQTAAIKAALDANPGRAFYFPAGDYRLDTGLVISQANSLVLDPDARIYAGAAMTTLITYLWNGTGYAEDKALTGGLLDGALNAQRILSIGKVIRFTLERTNFKDGINRGLVTEAGLGAEIIASNLRFYNSGITNVADNIAIEAKMGDSHYRDIIIRDWTTAVKDTAFNRWDRVHPWISQNSGANTQMTSRYPTSIGFDITGNSDLQACVSDTYRYAYKFRTNGTGYTAPARLLNCRAMWANDPILPTALATANPAYCLDNSDGVGFISDRFTATGHTAAPGNFLTGPSTNITTRNTFSYGYILGAQGTTTDPMDYRAGVQQGTLTFTPTLIGSGGAGTHTYNSRSGRMVVNGDEVTYYVRMNVTTDSTNAFQGVARISGLPFPAGATNLRDGAGAVGLATNVPAAAAAIYNTASPSVPYIALMSQGATGTTEIDIAGQALRAKTMDIMVRISTTYFRQ